MKTIYLLLFSVFLVQCTVFAQHTAPNIIWDRCYNVDYINGIILPLREMPDGNFVMGGYYTGWPNENFWLAKVNPDGVLIWEKRWGDSLKNCIRNLEPTTDGGFVACGGIDDNTIYGIHSPQIFDYYHFNMRRETYNGNYIIKFDSTGTEEWSRIVNSSPVEVGNAVQPIQDGNYIVVGMERTRNNSDTVNAFVKKIDSRGNTLWHKTIRGSDYNELLSVQLTSEGGYIAVGKQNIIDRNTDGWIVKLDSSGNVQWEQTLGAAKYDMFYDIQTTNDRGFILTGAYTHYTPNEDSQTDMDFWVVKLDSIGTIEWDRKIGSIDSAEIAYSIYQTYDNGYIVGGQQIRGHTSDNYTWKDIWVVKITSNSTLEWTKNIGGSHTDICNTVRQSRDSSYMIAGYTKSSDGDISCYYSGAHNNIYNVAWLVKLEAPPRNTTSVSNTSSPTTAIYPNPAKDKLNIVQSSGSNIDVYIYDYTGRLVLTQPLQKSQTEIDIRSLTAGVYIVQLISSNSCSTKKIIIK